MTMFGPLMTEEAIAEMKDNLTIFSVWISKLKSTTDIYNKFTKRFSSKYQVDLYESINYFFHKRNYVTDDMLYHLKLIVYDLIMINKNLADIARLIVFVPETKSTNLTLVNIKSMFKCFVGDEFICYFKENGEAFYVN